MTMLRQQRGNFQKFEVKPVTMNIPESRNSADVDSGCARAQITYKHQDETQIIRLQETRQNADKQNKKSE